MSLNIKKQGGKMLFRFGLQSFRFSTTRCFVSSRTTTKIRLPLAIFIGMMIMLLLVQRTSGLENRTDRMVAFAGTWQSCLDSAQIEQYTHVVIAFAVTYTWTETKNICSETCEIFDPLICNNSYNATLMDTLRAQGKKVMLSFGGAAMGGSWEPDLSLGCWQYCFGRETQVVQRLVEIVETYQFDGVDIDYEWYYEDNQDDSGFSKGAEAIQFLSQVTLGLRQQLPPNAIVTHAPMDTDLLPGTQYFELLRTTIGPVLDFLMPQYYNGVTWPAFDGFDNTSSTTIGSITAATHYQTLVQDIFNGDATRIVFGFCIRECGDYNMPPFEAAKIMCDVRSLYPDNGGAGFWVAGDDVGGQWSSVVNQALRGNGTDCTIQTNAPQVFPSQSPFLPSDAATPGNITSAPITMAPSTFIPVPTIAPTVTKTNVVCGENTFEPCCPPEFTGMRAFDACTKFYHCVGGVLSGNPIPCDSGLLFHDATQTCDFEQNVPCFVPSDKNPTVVPTLPNPTAMPTAAPSTKIPSAPLQSTRPPQEREEPGNSTAMSTSSCESHVDASRYFLILSILGWLVLFC